MHLEQLQPGDIVYAARDITNDGSMPFMAEDAIIVKKGTRGVLINTGHLEEDESQDVYLVRFENDDKDLLDPIGCWPEDLTPMLLN